MWTCCKFNTLINRMQRCPRQPLQASLIGTATIWWTCRSYRSAWPNLRSRCCRCRGWMHMHNETLSSSRRRLARHPTTARAEWISLNESTPFSMACCILWDLTESISIFYYIGTIGSWHFPRYIYYFTNGGKTSLVIWYFYIKKFIFDTAKF